MGLQLEKYGLSFDNKKCTTSGWAMGDENVIGIISFKIEVFDITFEMSIQTEMYFGRYVYFVL